MQSRFDVHRDAMLPAGRRSNWSDACDSGRHGIEAEELDEVVHSGWRGESDDIATRDLTALSLVDRGSDGAIGLDDIDRPTLGS